MKNNEEVYWAHRNTEFQLQATVRERDAYKTQVEWLQSQLRETLDRLDRAHSRYHDISIAHADVLDRALDTPMSIVKPVIINGRSVMVLENPVVPGNGRRSIAS